MQTESMRLSEEVKAHFSARASLAALGMALRQRRILAPISKHVHIAQKTVKYSPDEKLQDALINMLCGAQGMVEINKRVKPDTALQRAFGRDGCAEQSVVQDTLDACSQQNVEQGNNAQNGKTHRASGSVVCGRMTRTTRYGRAWSLSETSMINWRLWVVKFLEPIALP